MLIIAIAAALVLGSGISFYLFLIQPNYDRYQTALEELASVPIEVPAASQALLKEINRHDELNKTTAAVQKYVNELDFPIPSEPDTSCDGRRIIKNCTGILDKGSIAFAGTEQLILMAFPPEQLAECIIFATESLIGHTSQATAESLLVLKASLLEGAINAQDPQILLECLKQFSMAVLEGLKNPAAMHGLLDALEHQHMFNIVCTFVNWHTITQGLDPAMHLHQHFHEIAQSFTGNTLQASHAIAHHASVTLHPDPTGHFPVITLFLSGLREIQLLSDNKTSLDNSMANIALDLAGTGIGGALGAKGGALIGTLICPGLGTLIGGIFGALTGAMGGRALTDTIKYDNLKSALNDYSLTYSHMLAGTNRVALDCVYEIRDVAMNSRADFYEIIGEAPELDLENQTLIRTILGLNIIQRQEVQKHDKSLLKFKSSIFARLPRSKRMLLELERRLYVFEKTIPSDSFIAAAPIEAAQQLLAAPVFKSPAYCTEIERSLSSHKLKNRNHASMLILWAINAANEYENSIALILEAFQTQSGIFHEACERWTGPLNRKKDDVINEQMKLGLA